MNSNAYNNEVQKIVKLYIIQFKEILMLFIFGNLASSIINMICGAYIFAFFNILFILPSIILVIYRKINQLPIASTTNDIILVICCLFLDFFCVAIIYDRKHPFLFWWFILLFYNLNTIIFQKKAISLHLFIIFTMFMIYYAPFLDFSEYCEQIHYYFFWKFSHFALIVCAIIYLETINNRFFERILGGMLVRNIELEDYKQKQIHIQKVKDHFFATISHEMRTPLNAIKGISDLLISDKLVNSEVIEYQTIMNYSSNHLLSLINDVLDYSKINLGEFKLTQNTFSIEENVDFIFKINQNMVNQKKLMYELIKKSDFPKYVYGDTQRFNQVLMNIISNAIKFTEKGSVQVIMNKVVIEKNKINLIIEIIDTGIGIANENLNAIFERYYQSKNNITSNGIGLGLYITKEIIDLMGGTISVKSTLNIGTCFVIQIPFEIAQIQSTSSYVNDVIIENLSNLKILIVEDNKINQKILQKLLLNNLKKCTIIIAENGKKAIDLLIENKFDIVLMDILMPIMNGIEATKQIRTSKDENLKKIPIIALTANTINQDFYTCQKVGFDAVITKPYEIHDVIVKMYSLIQLTSN
ncbi:hybrid sensor histidine kinase/response regulator [Flavobacterium branchiophilum]|uniref:histidine kinase n=2 Tax=Flavobacterium branchiophilum TaxID=55197 RepID=A0A2H3KEC9_9FLAO|nr:hybrid sensor histidine kinase/response regulator [Flavobacterium branchiophilum]